MCPKAFQKLILLSLIIFLAAPHSFADITAPFYFSNSNPFVKIYGLPSAESAQLIPKSKLKLGLQLEASSNFSFDNYLSRQPSKETIVIDGETHRNNVQIRYGYSDALEIGLDVSYLRHKAGGLDNFITDWHRFFGLPNGGRENFPENGLQYSYHNNDETFVLEEPARGLGDVTMKIAYSLYETPTQEIALRAGVKLPTGNAAKLLGSKSSDFYLGVNISEWESSAFRWHASAGILRLGEGEVLNRQRKDWVVYGSSTVVWLFNNNIVLKAQIDAHSTFYDSATKELGGEAAQLLLGGAIRFNKNTVLDLSVSEDIVVDTSPDVVFQMAITFKNW